jgi:hypothetical protein
MNDVPVGNDCPLPRVATVRHTEFWSRMEDALGSAYYHVWAVQFVMAELGGRTAAEALEAGLPPKQVWAAVWQALDLPSRDK